MREEINSYKEDLHRLRWNIQMILKNKRFDLIIRMIVGILLIGTFAWIGMKESANGMITLQKGIASEIIRFHVIANSDTDCDQEVKLKVKDAVIASIKPRMQKTNDINEAREELLNQMDGMKAVAERTLRENGFHYEVEISLRQEEFPIKVYKDITLPAGTYESLCIRIGKAQGHNWWCIVFPSLCFVDETYSYVPKESKMQLRNVLSEDEYKVITKKEEIEEEPSKIIVKPKFAILDYLKKIF